MVGKSGKLGDRPKITQQLPTDGAGASTKAQTAKTDDVSTPKHVITDGKDEFAPRLLAAAKARDVNEVKNLVTSWVNAQTDYDAMSEGLLALSNFLRVFGSGESNPKLYSDILALEPPKDSPFDQGTLDLKRGSLDQLGVVLAAIGKGHVTGEVDIQAGDQQAIKGLLVASSMGLMTDALKVKMAGWNAVTPQLAGATTSFELGIRKMPSGSDTNFWVIGGVNKALEWIKNLRVSPEAVDWMKSNPLFENYPREFFQYFKAPTDADGVRVPGQHSPFENDVKRCKIESLQDGEIYMGGPIMRVTGPPAAVEFLETNLMRLVTSWTTVATAAAQMSTAAGDKKVAYFGPRRAPGGEDTTEAISKAAAIGGMTVSSDLLAGYMGHTVTGTMEHSIMLMLKTVFKHDPPPFTQAQKDKGAEFLRAAWKSDDPSLTDAQLTEKVEAQLGDLLVESHIFKSYANRFDKEKSVALIDTSHPNIGTAAAMLSQHMLWEDSGKDQNMNAIRLDSGCLLAQGLQFRRLFNEQGMDHMKTLATDGLLPETVKFFEAVEKEILKGQAQGGLQPSFYELMKNAPPSGAEGDEIPLCIRQAEALVAAGGLKEGQTVFAGYGAGEKIADSVSTVGRPGIVYKASQMTFTSETTGEDVTVNMGKIPSPSKATGPNRQLLAKLGADGKIEQWVIASPTEKPGNGFQRLMKPVYENGQIKINTSNDAAVKYGASRRQMLTDDVLDGGAAKLGMTDAYKKEWLAVVEETDPTRVAEYAAYFDKNWPTVGID